MVLLGFAQAAQDASLLDMFSIWVDSLRARSRVDAYQYCVIKPATLVGKAVFAPLPLLHV